ncbi:MAG: hypothetical protein IKL55_07035 [Clostridia bacterium]|nr:hypothetical protein [Clostridia bacterium]
MNKYDDNNPIQENDGSIFLKLKRFEENDEYDFEKQEKDYMNSIKESSRNNENKNSNNSNYYSTTKFYDSNYVSAANLNSLKTFLKLSGILFLIWIIIRFVFFLSIFSIGENHDVGIKKTEMTFEKSLGSETPELNDDMDNVQFSRVPTITFDKAGSIPTLYKYDKNTKANWCDFTKLDPRFNGKANTVQVNYDTIPISSKEKLIKGLEDKYYQFVNSYPTGDLYAINTSSGYYLFVLISSNNIIYGAAYGDYHKIF